MANNTTHQSARKSVNRVVRKLLTPDCEDFCAGDLDLDSEWLGRYVFGSVMGHAFGYTGISPASDEHTTKNTAGVGEQ